jgi:hypothetical protein
MRKLICLGALFATINSYSQNYETKFIDQSVITFNCESFVFIHDFSRIETNSSISFFRINSGGLQISISGLIDRNSPPQIMIDLFAKENLGNEMVIITGKDSQQVQYRIEGSGSGIYGGRLNDDDRYIVNTRFKIVAPGHPDLLLSLPLNVRISRMGSYNLTHCFIDGTAYLYTAEKKKNKKRNAN